MSLSVFLILLLFLWHKLFLCIECTSKTVLCPNSSSAAPDYLEVKHLKIDFDDNTLVLCIVLCTQLMVHSSVLSAALYASESAVFLLFVSAFSVVSVLHDVMVFESVSSCVEVVRYSFVIFLCLHLFVDSNCHFERDFSRSCH